ncbi:type IV pili methyl-accepting chemotaxis transducer N-terminal domain-containing protein [Reichenbachiella agariperforans]|uniref:type IV pili methyl-accepting chemotaxis transducer N-terminal domain-containing protein n=1 Tax=Reichenbachiella agariperforans TaxID=156994 RepID=UPI001C082F5D|nr:type IV pili methyl-accepting chemotaxis transducer N-terminal domain-containing protein [Reichenbachiella agariperforans]MBU2915486.1 type IV pili methyl-accepting chemotaxis transducer N-terminal domain-containing protein [Reichenbachiella agariperforans]
MKKLSVQYLLFLGVLTVAIVASQILIQKAIADSKTDSRIINISGRQRMLSQKITKAALKLQSCKTREDFYAVKLELTTAADLWAESHDALQHGNANIDVSEMNASPILISLFSNIQPYYDSIIGAVGNIRTLGFSSSIRGSEKDTLVKSIKTISDNEANFLQLMNDITFEHDRLAHQKVEELSTSEYYLLAVALVLILLEAFFIFRPMFKSAKKKESEISDLHEYVQQSISYLGKSQEGETLINEANETIKKLKSENSRLKTKVKNLKKAQTITNEE